MVDVMHLEMNLEFNGFNSAYWVILHAFYRLLIFLQNQLLRKKKTLSGIQMSNILDSYQARQYSGPDLGPNCLQRLAYQQTTLVDKKVEKLSITGLLQMYMKPMQQTSFQKIFGFNC